VRINLLEITVTPIFHFYCRDVFLEKQDWFYDWWDGRLKMLIYEILILYCYNVGRISAGSEKCIDFYEQVLSHDS
jgi:hypothetical protein